MIERGRMVERPRPSYGQCDIRTFHSPEGTHDTPGAGALRSPLRTATANGLDQSLYRKDRLHHSAATSASEIGDLQRIE